MKVRVTNIDGNTRHELVGQIGDLLDDSGDPRYVDLPIGITPLYYSEFEVWA